MNSKGQNITHYWGWKKFFFLVKKSLNWSIALYEYKMTKEEDKG